MSQSLGKTENKKLQHCFNIITIELRMSHPYLTLIKINASLKLSFELPLIKGYLLTPKKLLFQSLVPYYKWIM